MERNIRYKMSDGKEIVLKQIGNYKFLGKTLGKGNFARVELAEHKLTGAKVAVKIINLRTIKEDYVKRNILREAIIMKKVRHDNVIKLYETLKYDCIYCLVTELVKGGDLRTYVQQQKGNKLTETRARSFFRQLLSAVKHLHESGIVHRDLKMDNILLDETKTVVKIVDFGLSNLFNKGELLRTHCGSPEYAAPELFEKGCLYGPSVDVWSMGVVLYGMVIGHLPFSTMFRGFIGKDELYNHAKKGLTIAHEKYLGKISSGCRSLLTKLLQPDPTKRILFDQMVHHSWITEDGKNPLVKMPSFLIPKLIRAKVIDHVAMLCSKSISDAELHVQGSSHDAVCAVYNLLLDDAMKEYKSKSKQRTKQRRPCSSVRRKASDGKIAKKADPNITTKMKIAEKSDKGDKTLNDGKCRPERTGAIAVPDESMIGDAKSSPSDNTKPQSSSVKIVEFTDAIKLEGRATSPVLKKPSPVNRFRKAYKPQHELNTQSAHHKKVMTSMQSKISDSKSRKEQQEFSQRPRSETKRQIFCDNVSKRMEPYCRITRFPEEDRSAKRPKVDLHSSSHAHDPKQLLFAAGFKVTSLAKKMESISLNGTSNSFHGYNAKVSGEKPNGSRSFDHAATKTLPRSKSPIVAVRNASYQSTKIDCRGQILVGQHKQDRGNSTVSSPTPGRSVKLSGASKSMHHAPTNTCQRFTPRRYSLPTYLSSEKTDKRFGNAFSELKQRIGATQSRNKDHNAKMMKVDTKKEENKYDKGKMNRNCKDKMNVNADFNGCLDMEKPIMDQNEDHSSNFLATETEGKQNCEPIVSDDLEAKSESEGEFLQCEKGSVGTGRVTTPQCQIVSLIDDQRRGSSGILKTPSRCSSADFASEFGRERRKLKVTFEDEVFKKLQNETLKMEAKKLNQRPIRFDSRHLNLTSQKHSVRAMAKTVR